MKRLLFLLWLSINTLSAEPVKPLMIDSDLVNYDGKLIHLTGHATVDHELGKIEAQQVTIVPEKEGKKMRFQRLMMNNDVKISLQDGGELNCTNADIDYHALTGKFSAGDELEFVVYKENLKDKKSSAATPVEVKSKEMKIHLQRHAQPEGEEKMVISQIITDQDVSVIYNEEFIAMADYGIYQRWAPQTIVSGDLPVSQSKLMGFFSLQANQPRGICQVRHRNGDYVNAKKMDIDFVKRELKFEAPQGFLSPKENQNEIEFTSGTMVWNEPKDLLTLYKDIEVVYRGVGTLKNPSEVRIYRQMKEGRKQVQFVECLGHSILNYQDPSKGETHTLTTHQKFSLDRQLLQAHLESPRDANNRVLEKLQVHFTGPMGEVYADEVYIYYQEVDQKLQAQKLFLKGNVWLLKRTSADKDDPGKIVHFAISDRVEYDLASNEMLFLADYNTRVLFFDKGNNLQVSAPSVKVKRDQQMQKDVIQGIGDVRFSFLEKELQLLQKRFGASDFNSGDL